MKLLGAAWEQETRLGGSFGDDGVLGGSETIEHVPAVLAITRLVAAGEHQHGLLVPQRVLLRPQGDGLGEIGSGPFQSARRARALPRVTQGP